MDGDFGPNVKRAVVAYQKAHGAKADGVVGPETWSHLEKQLPGERENLGKTPVAELPNVGKVATATAAAVSLGQAKAQLEAAAAQVGGLAALDLPREVPRDGEERLLLVRHPGGSCARRHTSSTPRSTNRSVSPLRR